MPTSLPPYEVVEGVCLLTVGSGQREDFHFEQVARLGVLYVDRPKGGVGEGKVKVLEGGGLVVGADLVVAAVLQVEEMSAPAGTVRTGARALFHFRWAFEAGMWKEWAILIDFKCSTR